MEPLQGTTHATLAVPVSFTLQVDAGIWAGADADVMTTAEVIEEVQKHVENAIRKLGTTEGWLPVAAD